MKSPAVEGSNIYKTTWISHLKCSRTSLLQEERCKGNFLVKIFLAAPCQSNRPERRNQREVSQTEHWFFFSSVGFSQTLTSNTLWNTAKPPENINHTSGANWSPFVVWPLPVSLDAHPPPALFPQKRRTSLTKTKSPSGNHCYSVAQLNRLLSYRTKMKYSKM